jgi:pyruvate dehydrogenase E1 component beta subunit
LGSQHSTSVESLFAHFPGLKVVTFATAYDAKGLLKAAIRDPNPVVFLESEMTYGIKGEVPDEEYIIELGKADIKRSGTDVTLITWGKQLFTVQKAAESLMAQGIDVEIVDLRSLRPLDHETVFNSVVKTGRAVVIHEGFIFAGVGAELVSRIQEACFDVLQAPVLRVTNRDVPQPYATNLEKLVYPSEDRIIAAVQQVMER